MKYERFEDLPVWKAAVELADRVYSLTRHRFFAQPGDLREQIRSAALSVSNNIAEGFERGSTAELIAFLYIARGSAGEVRSMLLFCNRLLDAQSEISNLKSEISDLKSEISNLIPLAESCSRQIRAWTDSLQNTDIKGQRHLNDHSRAQYEGKQRVKDFQRQIAENLHRARPQIFPDPDSAQ